MTKCPDQLAISESDRTMKRTSVSVLFCGLAVLLVVGAGMVLRGQDRGRGVSPTVASPAAAASRANPVSTGRRVANVAFYYDGTVPLSSDNLDGLYSVLGHPAIVVSTPGSEGGDEVEAIHAMGAKAYRYVQFYWAPDNEVYEGINLQAHPEWAFCRSGQRGAIG